MRIKREVRAAFTVEPLPVCSSGVDRTVISGSSARLRCFAASTRHDRIYIWVPASKRLTTARPGHDTQIQDNAFLIVYQAFCYNAFASCGQQPLFGEGLSARSATNQLVDPAGTWGCGQRHKVLLLKSTSVVRRSRVGQKWPTRQLRLSSSSFSDAGEAESAKLRVERSGQLLNFLRSNLAH